MTTVIDRCPYHRDGAEMYFPLGNNPSDQQIIKIMTLLKYKYQLLFAGYAMQETVSESKSHYSVKPTRRNVRYHKPLITDVIYQYC